MKDPAVYLDASALVKLVFDEDGTADLRRFLADWPHRACSILGRVEVLRTARTIDDSLVERHAHDALKRVVFIDLDSALIRHAMEVEPRTLRALDAIHLATALSLMPHLAGMVAYDRQLLKAAGAAGLKTWAPRH
ncbi:MAG TPA: type II toxin-antitoxin system VapC family toxin [Vicinamibacterales bacterium]|nr:type II toxin-antitoxin system VapC family toxin [Vicinamibacterales bacterium]